MKNKPTKALVWVRWFDASYQRGECTQEEIIPRVEMESAGLLVQESPESISIALDWCPQERVWRYIQNIPRVNVLAIKKFPPQR